MNQEHISGGRPFQPILGVRIAGTYAAFPEPIRLPNGMSKASFSNEDIFGMLLGENYAEILNQKGMDVHYPEQVVGIKERSWTHIIGTPANHQEENTVDLGIKAVKGLLAKLNLDVNEIDMMIFSSTTPHKITSSSACAIGAELDMRVPSLDLKAGCSSGLYSLLNACMHVKSGFNRVLLVASETPTKYANPHIHETVLGVGDGAVAFLLEATEENTGILGGFLGADGELGKLVNTPGLLPPTPEAIEQNLYKYHGESTALKESVFPRYLQAMKGALKVANLTPADLDIYVPHQVNRSLTQKVAQVLEIPEDKQYYNLHRHGSVAGAAILIALHEAIEDNRVKTGYKIGLNVVGGGLTWGGMIWQY